MSGEREDGRGFGQLRPLGCELRPLARCDGSARFNFNKTSALAGVFGPSEAKSSVKLSDESVLVVNYSAASGPPSFAEKQMQSIVRQALESLVVRSQNPLCVIEVTLQCCHDDGGLLAASINASIAAMVDAGVALRGQAAAVCIAVGADGALLLDPTREESLKAVAVLTFVMDAEDGGIISSHCSGCCPEETYFEALEAANAASRTILTFLRIAIEKRIAVERACWSAS